MDDKPESLEKLREELSENLDLTKKTVGDKYFEKYMATYIESAKLDKEQKILRRKAELLDNKEVKLDPDKLQVTSYKDGNSWIDNADKVKAFEENLGKADKGKFAGQDYAVIELKRLMARHRKEIATTITSPDLFNLSEDPDLSSPPYNLLKGEKKASYKKSAEKYRENPEKILEAYTKFSVDKDPREMRLALNKLDATDPFLAYALGELHDTHHDTQRLIQFEVNGKEFKEKSVKDEEAKIKKTLKEQGNNQSLSGMGTDAGSILKAAREAVAPGLKDVALAANDASNSVPSLAGGKRRDLGRDPSGV